MNCFYYLEQKVDDTASESEGSVLVDSYIRSFLTGNKL